MAAVIAKNRLKRRKLHALIKAANGGVHSTPCGLVLRRALRHFELIEFNWSILPNDCYDAVCESRACARFLAGAAPRTCPSPARSSSPSAGSSSSSS